MVSIKDMLTKASDAMERTVEFRGLMSKMARIKHGAGKKPSDILGWDYVARDKDGSCYSFYAAQPPLMGMTRPEPVNCPLGLVAFDSYEVKFEQAIKVMDGLNCGDTFMAMSLSWPLTPMVKEPIWHIRTTVGNDIAIGAYSCDSHCSSPIVLLYGVQHE